MKKLLFISLLLTCYLFGFSQDEKIRLGLNLSPQFSWMVSDAAGVESDGTKIGFNFGLVSDFFFAERYSLTTGVSINNTGGMLNYTDSIGFQTNNENLSLANGAKIQYNIQYIDIPLAFKMESNRIGYFVYYAQFGITNHIRVGATADISSTDLNYSGVGCKDEVAFFNMAYNIGGGGTYYFSKNTGITLGVLYNNGFLDATKNGKVNDRTSNRTILVKAGIVF